MTHWLPLVATVLTACTPCHTARVQAAELPEHWDVLQDSCLQSASDGDRRVVRVGCEEYTYGLYAADGFLIGTRLYSDTSSTCNPTTSGKRFDLPNGYQISPACVERPGLRWTNESVLPPDPAILTGACLGESTCSLPGATFTVQVSPNLCGGSDAQVIENGTVVASIEGSTWHGPTALQACLEGPFVASSGCSIAP